jgi:hypothetical protein
MCFGEAVKNHITVLNSLITMYDLLFALMLFVNDYAFFQQSTYVDVLSVISE